MQTTPFFFCIAIVCYEIIVFLVFLRKLWYTKLNEVLSF